MLSEGVRTFDFTRIIGRDAISFGSPVIIDDFVLIYARAPMTFGNFVHIASFTSITGGAEFSIGNYSAVSQGCRILTGTDDFTGWGFGNSTVPEEYRNVKRSPIKIGDFCIVGANSVVLPGITIGDGVTIGACSVITRDLPPWGVYIGNKRIRDRNKDAVLKNLETFKRDYDL
jgi:galactoside O-acetyltransferase